MSFKYGCQIIRIHFINVKSKSGSYTILLES